MTFVYLYHQSVFYMHVALLHYPFVQAVSQSQRTIYDVVPLCYQIDVFVEIISIFAYFCIQYFCIISVNRWCNNNSNTLFSVANVSIIIFQPSLVASNNESFGYFGSKQSLKQRNNFNVASLKFNENILFIQSTSTVK